MHGSSAGRFVIALTALWLPFCLAPPAAAGLRWDSAGIRTGGTWETTRGEFAQTELFGRLDLPWSWSKGAWRLQTHWDGSLGVLSRFGRMAFLGAMGLAVSLRSGRFPLGLTVGSSPTLLGRDEFGRIDFGVPFQVTSHFGVFAALGGHALLGCRFQHMSNASLSEVNPGLNPLLFTFAWRP